MAARHRPRRVTPYRPLRGPDLSGLEHHLRTITTQIGPFMHQPYEDALTHALRGDLAEIGRALTDALPRRAIEAPRAEVAPLGERLDRSKQSGVDSQALVSLEQALAEIRDALRTLTPAESLVGFEEAVRGLSRKIDHIGASNQDLPPLATSSNRRSGSLRRIISTSPPTARCAQLSAEVHGLAARFERAASESSSDALVKLETRIASLMESGRSVPPELEGSIRTLSRAARPHAAQPGRLTPLGAAWKTASPSWRKSSTPPGSRLQQSSAPSSAAWPTC